MAKKEILEINLTQYVEDVIFDKKNDVNSTSHGFNLEKQIVCYLKDVLNIKVQSVFLPLTYNVSLKTQQDVINWLCKRI